MRFAKRFSPDQPSSTQSLPRPNSIVEMIAEVAQAWPERVALRKGATGVTYRALMAAADALAAELADCGAGPEIPIGICTERSVQHVVAILGTLRAGSAFLPLDPDWPADRICRVLDDAGAAAVIAAPQFAATLSAPNRVVVSSERDLGRHGAARNLPVVSGRNLAYIIYTSGSTGEPKGVEITHDNLLNLALWHRDAFGISADDRASWTAGLAFDASVWELFPYLAVGACIHVPEERVRGSAEALRDWFVEQAITIGFAPTPLAEGLLAANWPAQTALRMLLTGGDTLHVWPKPGLPFRVVNNYGPTECTVVATSGMVAAGRERSALPTIGRPIANTRVAILDANGLPVPKGEVGEIYVAGAGVARGYRNRPSLTAERFPTISQPDGVAVRYYRTGDLGCWTEQGEIAFHGRSDDQIKVRGHRIEPDEISAALLRHPGVAQSVVVAEGDGADKRLIAYVVVVAGSEAPRAGELRDFLAASLPNYMLPSIFVRIPAPPLTANGKLDKSALPAPTPANALSGFRYRAPASSVESRIAALVEELLGVRGVGVDDNFFLLGGHSLLGTQLVLRLRDAFGAELTLRDLFEAQTIQNLARKVEETVMSMVASMSEEELQERLVH
jgi:amino acid adenylation domain-containing protein